MKQFSSTLTALCLWAICFEEIRASVVENLPLEETRANEVKVVSQTVVDENCQLRNSLSEYAYTLTQLKQLLTGAEGEIESFRRQSIEMKLRIEASGFGAAGDGSGKLEERFLSAMRDLRGMSRENVVLSQALVRIIETVSLCSRNMATSDPNDRLLLESELRYAKSLLSEKGQRSGSGEAVESLFSEGSTISLREDLSLIVINLGTRNGVALGMPLDVIRGSQLVGSVRVVDVRDRIAGAIVQNLTDGEDGIKIGDRLTINARR